ncbi:hypothetical protein K9B40_25060, partial [Klebsiella aerogenes]|nr:hypothetical protein [Klebsiella aerogenes]
HMEAAYDISSRRVIEAAAAASSALDVLVQKEGDFKEDPSSAEAAAAFHRADAVYTAATEALQKAADIKRAVVAARIKACGD